LSKKKLTVGRFFFFLHYWSKKKENICSFSCLFTFFFWSEGEEKRRAEMGPRLATASNPSSNLYGDIAADLAGYEVLEKIGSGMLMPSYQCAHDDGIVVVKVFVRHSMDLTKEIQKVEGMNKN
jgi:hypothetical protein